MSDIVKALELALERIPSSCYYIVGTHFHSCPRFKERICEWCDRCERDRAAIQAAIDSIPVLEWHGDTAHLGAWTLTVRSDGSWTIYVYTLLAGRGGNDSQEGSRLMVENILRAFGVSFRTRKTQLDTKKESAK